MGELVELLDRRGEVLRTVDDELRQLVRERLFRQTVEAASDPAHHLDQFRLDDVAQDVGPAVPLVGEHQQHVFVDGGELVADHDEEDLPQPRIADHDCH
ncbi:hypothetical protein [Micromonospora craniellae]|uniref:Uncharacterized protein n=1 Tax=Micromonospora craniellae TaxID=2294034 RepID=A0A372FYE8_9ACTN|nr:hypothetical protein [Micromonospora craniellae]RFS45556.1 hypothetical protein D0Q02_15750 [Micromonospora craniellae]